MDKKQELTPWFDGKTKPARPGVYQRKSPLAGNVVWSRWDEGTGLWSVFCQSAAKAAARKAPSEFQALPWRGLAAPAGGEA